MENERTEETEERRGEEKVNTFKPLFPLVFEEKSPESKLCMRIHSYVCKVQWVVDPFLNLDAVLWHL